MLYLKYFESLEDTISKMKGRYGKNNQITSFYTKFMEELSVFLNKLVFEKIKKIYSFKDSDFKEDENHRMYYVTSGIDLGDFILTLKILNTIFPNPKVNLKDKSFDSNPIVRFMANIVDKLDIEVDIFCLGQTEGNKENDYTRENCFIFDFKLETVARHFEKEILNHWTDPNILEEVVKEIKEQQRLHGDSKVKYQFLMEIFSHLGTEYGFFDMNEYNRHQQIRIGPNDGIFELDLDTGDLIESKFLELVSNDIDYEDENGEKISIVPTYVWIYDSTTNILEIDIDSDERLYTELKKLLGEEKVKIIGTHSLAIETVLTLDEIIDFINEREPDFFNKVAKDLPENIKQKYSYLGTDYGFFDVNEEYRYRQEELIDFVCVRTVIKKSWFDKFGYQTYMVQSSPLSNKYLIHFEINANILNDNLEELKKIRNIFHLVEWLTEGVYNFEIGVFPNDDGFYDYLISKNPEAYKELEPELSNKLKDKWSHLGQVDYGFFDVNEGLREWTAKHGLQILDDSGKMDEKEVYIAKYFNKKYGLDLDSHNIWNSWVNNSSKEIEILIHDFEEDILNYKSVLNKNEEICEEEETFVYVFINIDRFFEEFFEMFPDKYHVFEPIFTDRFSLSYLKNKYCHLANDYGFFDINEATDFLAAEDFKTYCREKFKDVIDITGRRFYNLEEVPRVSSFFEDSFVWNGSFLEYDIFFVDDQDSSKFFESELILRELKRTNQIHYYHLGRKEKRDIWKIGLKFEDLIETNPNFYSELIEIGYLRDEWIIKKYDYLGNEYGFFDTVNEQYQPKRNLYPRSLYPIVNSYIYKLINKEFKIGYSDFDLNFYYESGSSTCNKFSIELNLITGQIWTEEIIKNIFDENNIKYRILDKKGYNVIHSFELDMVDLLDHIFTENPSLYNKVNIEDLPPGTIEKWGAISEYGFFDEVNESYENFSIREIEKPYCFVKFKDILDITSPTNSSVK